MNNSNAKDNRPMSADYRAELHEKFKQIDKNNDGYIDLKELRDALDVCGFRLPAYEIRKMEDEFKNEKSAPNGKLSYEAFESLCNNLKSSEVASSFKQVVSAKVNLKNKGGTSMASNEGTKHSVRIEEQLAFSDWINSNLKKDPDLKHLLPIDADGNELYHKVQDGILLCKVINHSCPETIDERAINKNQKNVTVYSKLENLTLALTSAQAIGCNVVNIDAASLSKGIEHLVLGLVWQIIRIGLFNQITLENCPGLPALMLEGEQIEDLMKLSPEAILIRWVNYHLNRAGVNRRINNFQSDISDSEVYTHLLKQIAPNDAGVNTDALFERDMTNRAEIMLQQAAKLQCRAFVTPQDVTNGVYKLNVAFVANLFNNHPALDNTNALIENYEAIEETREEKTYRNWINSMGVSPHVNWLYSDLSDANVVFQLYEIIRPGMVDFNRVHKKFNPLRQFMEKLENCNYAVQLGKQINFSLVGIAGHDISEGKVTLTLALVWQLMRAYTLSVLSRLADSGSPVVEKEIVEWVNNKLGAAGKGTSIRGFQDQSISDSRVIFDLIDAMKPGTVNYELLKTSNTPADKLANAKYAISMARKSGARVYALPEDITEVKPKMVMTIFACLMALDYIPNMDQKDAIAK